MPEIKLDKRTIDKVKNRQGLYHTIKADDYPKVEYHTKDTYITNYVRIQVKAAFQEYVLKHKNTTDADVVRFWKQFKPILERYL